MGGNGNACYFTADHFSRIAWFMQIDSKLPPPGAETRCLARPCNLSQHPGAADAERQIPRADASPA